MAVSQFALLTILSARQLDSRTSFRARVRLMTIRQYDKEWSGCCMYVCMFDLAWPWLLYPSRSVIHLVSDHPCRLPRELPGPAVDTAGRRR